MAMAIVTCWAERKNQAPNEVFCTHPPRNVAPSVSAPPMIDASTMRPGRILYMYNPTNSAMGIVQAIVKVPQLLPGVTRAASGASATAPLGLAANDAART